MGVVLAQLIADWADFHRDVERHYEPQLTSLGLGKADIERQSLHGLEESLRKLEQAVARKDSFGPLWLTVLNERPAISTTSTADGFEIDIEPTLAERKALIAGRIARLQSEHDSAVKRREFDTERAVKAVLAWGSVSYAFGFFTVTMHTAKLGLPMIELLQPTYIWVGLPLAIVAFFGRWLMNHLRRKGAAMAAEFRSLLETFVDHGESSRGPLTDAMKRATDALSTLLNRHVPLFPLRYRFRPLLRCVPYASQYFEKKQNDMPQEQIVAIVQACRRFTLIAYTSSIAAIFLYLLSIVSWLGLAAFIYVAAIYPAIPQGIGGGKAVPVRLVLDRDALPPGLVEQQQETRNRTDATTSKTVVQTATLLYATKEFFFVDLGSNNRLSIKASSIQAVQWNPK
jgi:hypothetical protein